MNLNKFFALILVFAFTICSSQAQSVLNVSYNNVVLSGVLHEFSVGEMALIGTEKNATLIVTQGFLQPKEMSMITSKDNTLLEFVNTVKVFPNPTHSTFTVELENEEEVSIQLYDALGRLIFEKSRAGKVSKIDLSSFSNGNYYLHINVTNNTKQFALFKIQKVE